MMDEIRRGDAVEELQALPDKSVHCIVTSPPYWDQRDYETDGQIGHEDSVEGYINHLIGVLDECYRVLRDDGSLLLNIGDTYTDKERNLIPLRVAERLRDEVGFLVRQDFVWEKEHAKPDPSTDRRTNSHEYVFHLTKNRDYWYDETACGGDHTSVITAPTATSDLDHVAVYSEELVEELLTGVAPPMVCNECEKPYARCYERVPRPFTGTERTQSQRARELYEDSELTEEHVEAIQAVGISDVGKAKRTEDGAGRNTENVQRLAQEAKDVLGGYYREFTMVERQPDGWQQACACTSSPVGGVICDPFIGSGTTAVVARKQGYRYVGIDINGEYVDTAKTRVSEVSI